MSSTTAAKKKLVLRRTVIARRRAHNDDDANELQEEKRPDELAENHEISDVLVLLSNKENADLREIDAALGRLERGTWGRCETCNRRIEARRLTVRPEARTCGVCAQ
jgi:DnaK suppressor protein